MRRSAVLAAVSLAAAGSVVGAPSASAGVDTAFGSNGRYAVEEVDNFAIAVRPNGNIVAVGVNPFAERTFRVVELQPDGTPRPGFGTAGTVNIGVPGATGTPDDIARIFEPQGLELASDGGLVVQFNTSVGNAVAKVRADGTLDPAFGGGAGYRTDMHVQCGLPTDLTISPVDGAITTIAHDFGDPKPGCKGTGLRRYSANGTKLEGWGGASFEGGRIESRLVGVAGAHDAAGNLYVSGVTFDNKAGVVKITPTGQNAAGFGTDGLVSFDPVASQAYEYMGYEGGYPRTLGNKTANDVAVDGNGRILLAGTTRTADSSSLDVWVARLLPDGTLDASFGSGGIAIVDVAGGRDDYGLELTVDSANRPVIAGSTRTSTPRPTPPTLTTTASTDPRQQFVIRLTTSGQKDATADTIVTQYGAASTPYAPYDIAVHGTDRVVVSGSFVDQWGIYRGYLGAGSLNRATGPTPLFNGIRPERVMDTRTGPGAGAFSAGVTRTVDVTGIGGLSGVPADGVVAVALNVTVVDPTAPGHLTVWPAGGARPTASVLNFSPGQTIANSLVVGVGTGGEVALQLSNGNAHVVVDVMGWIAADRGFVSATPVRAIDTRQTVALAPGETRDVVVVGNGVPADAEAVAVNITATEGAAGGHFRAWPAGGPVPPASVLNFAPGQTIANAMVLGVGSGGKISVRNYSAAPAHLVVDVMGSFAAGSEINAIAPARAMDTRESLGGASFTTGTVRTLQVTGIGGVPSTGVRAVVVNITVTNPSAAGHVTVWPAGGTAPTASVLNFAPGVTVANALVVGVDEQGRIALSNSFGTSDLVVDVLGWF